VFDEATGVEYTYFKISVAVRNVDFDADLSENLAIQMTAAGCTVTQPMECELKEFKSRDQAICKKNVPLP